MDEVTSAEIGPRPKLAWLNLKLLMIDHNYQRDALPRHVQRILVEFDWRYFQPPTVCPNEEEKYWVIDGQQRILAAKLHPAVDEVPCYIIDTPLTKDQADAFIRVNKNRQNVNPVNMYWAGLAAEDEKYLAVQRVLHNANAEVVQALGLVSPKTTNAVGCLLLCIRACGEENTGVALQILRTAHPTAHVLTAVLIRSLSVLFRDHAGLSMQKMISLLTKIDLAVLTTDVRHSRRTAGGSTVTLLVAEIVKRYTAAYRKE